MYGRLCSNLISLHRLCTVTFFLRRIYSSGDHCCQGADSKRTQVNIPDDTVNDPSYVVAYPPKGGKFGEYIVLALEICLGVTMEGTLRKGSLRFAGNTAETPCKSYDICDVPGQIFGCTVGLFFSFCRTDQTRCIFLGIYWFFVMWFTQNPRAARAGFEPVWGYVRGRIFSVTRTTNHLTRLSLVWCNGSVHPDDHWHGTRTFE